MLQLSLKDVQAGMVLGQNALGTKGQLLLGAGATLTNEQLDMLRTNRVQNVYIRPTLPASPAAKLEPAEVDVLLDSKFRFCDVQQPLMHELRRLSRNRLTRGQGEIE